MKRARTALTLLSTLTSKMLGAAAIALVVLPASAWASPIGFDTSYGFPASPTFGSLSTSLDPTPIFSMTRGPSLPFGFDLSGLGGLGAVGGAPYGASGPVTDLGLGMCGECVPTQCCPGAFPWPVLIPLALIPILYFLFRGGGGGDDGYYTLRPGDNPTGDVTPLSDPPPPVPEPASLTLLGAGLVSMAVWRRRRRR